MKQQNRTLIAAGIGMLLTMTPVFMAQAADAPKIDELPAVLVGAGSSSTSIVEAVDMATRAVSLRTEDGRLVNFTAGEEVRNLAQVRVGDRVVVSYEVGLVMALSPSSGSSINERREKLEAGRAELGQKPAGVIRETIEVIATVRAIDLKNRAVTLQGAKQTVTLPVAEDIKLDGIKVGDQVHAMYRESLAVRVEPAPAK